MVISRPLMTFLNLFVCISPLMLKLDGTEWSSSNGKRKLTSKCHPTQRNGDGTTIHQRSEIRDSVGELYVRSIMAYASRLEGRSAISFESFERCGEIIVKHPGLCRFTTGYVPQ